jgi:hypothetical protein
MRLNKIGTDDGIQMKAEILCALKKLGEKLNEIEEEFLGRNINAGLKQLELASNTIGMFDLKMQRE